LKLKTSEIAELNRHIRKAIYNELALFISLVILCSFFYWRSAADPIIIGFFSLFALLRSGVSLMNIWDISIKDYESYTGKLAKGNFSMGQDSYAINEIDEHFNSVQHFSSEYNNYLEKEVKLICTRKRKIIIHIIPDKEQGHLYIV